MTIRGVGAPRQRQSEQGTISQPTGFARDGEASRAITLASRGSNTAAFPTPSSQHDTPRSRRHLASQSRCNALYCTVRHPRNLDHTISRLFGLLPSHTSAAQLLAPLDCTPRTAMTSQPTTERPPLHLQTSSPSPKVPLLPSPFSLPLYGTN